MRQLISLKTLSKISKSITQSHQNPNSQSLASFHSLTKTPFPPKPTSFTSSSLLPTQPHHHQIHGVLSNSLLAKHFVSNPFSRGSIRCFIGHGTKLVRTLFPKDKTPSGSSFLKRRSWSSWSRGYSADNVVIGLLVANTAVFILWRVMDKGFMYRNFTISVDNFKSGRVHTLITSAFSHIDMGHIVSNMIGLYFFGSNIGRVFGPEFLLKLYLAGAVAGSVFFLVYHAFIVDTHKKRGTFYVDSSKIPGLGASGAVNAILLLDIFLFPKATLYFDFFIPVPAILLGIFLVGKDVLRIIEGDTQISGAAHLGGAVVAAAAWLRLRRGIRF